MFKIFKKTTVRQHLEIDDSLISEAKKPKKEVFSDYKNYRDKSIDWLKEHLKVIDEVVNNKKLGSKQQGNFILDGKKIYKSDITRDLFNKMFDNYTTYYFALKRYINVRKELEQIEKIKNEEFLVAGRAKEYNTEATNIEQELNKCLSNIFKLKQKIKEEVYSY
ncbi:MAG: hypothetical protein PHR26_02545 [Candidatus ainarchaeum sp.]|nr:hypothetical protein [Candidatus ainarchaeum sp.]MDD3975818.1 hypothetical protein [Candidatus ainarchaeum sp.]